LAHHRARFKNRSERDPQRRGVFSLKPRKKLQHCQSLQGTPCLEKKQVPLLHIQKEEGGGRVSKMKKKGQDRNSLKKVPVASTRCAMKFQTVTARKEEGKGESCSGKRKGADQQSARILQSVRGVWDPRVRREEGGRKKQADKKRPRQAHRDDNSRKELKRGTRGEGGGLGERRQRNKKKNLKGSGEGFQLPGRSGSFIPKEGRKT